MQRWASTEFMDLSMASDVDKWLCDVAAVPSRSHRSVSCRPRLYVRLLCSLYHLF